MAASSSRIGRRSPTPFCRASRRVDLIRRRCHRHRAMATATDARPMDRTRSSCRGRRVEATAAMAAGGCMGDWAMENRTPPSSPPDTETPWWKSVIVKEQMPTMLYMGRMIPVPSKSGHGRWRLKGRGRRLKCERGKVEFMKMSAIFRFHKPGHQCRWCGHHFESAFDVGSCETFSFIELPASPGPAD